jgi:hypothetical protein
MRILFTNVRLIPCLVRDGIERTIAPIATLLTSAPAPATLPAAAPTAQVGPTATHAAEIADRAAKGSNKVLTAGVTSVLDPVRDGFERAIAAPAEIAEEIRDSRLMIQLGMGLGFVYAGFVSVWFWFTRGRRDLRP